MEKIYNLKDKTPEEVINSYMKIALKSQLINEMWKKTGNYEDAMKLYEAYLKDKESKNE